MNGNGVVVCLRGASLWLDWSWFESFHFFHHYRHDWRNYRSGKENGAGCLWSFSGRLRCNSSRRLRLCVRTAANRFNRAGNPGNTLTGFLWWWTVALDWWQRRAQVPRAAIMKSPSIENYYLALEIVWNAWNFQSNSHT